MKLIEFLKLYDKESFPLVLKKDFGVVEIDSRPESNFKVTICFMCEEETWLTCNIQNEILIPWYDCEISSIHPDYVNEDNNSICVWLKDEDYILKNFKQHIRIEEDGRV